MDAQSLGAWIAVLIALVTAIGGGITAVVAYLSKRDKTLKSEMNVELDAIKLRVTKLENGQREARGSLVLSLECVDMGPNARELVHKAIAVLH